MVNMDPQHAGSNFSKIDFFQGRNALTAGFFCRMLDPVFFDGPTHATGDGCVFSGN